MFALVPLFVFTLVPLVFDRVPPEVVALVPDVLFLLLDVVKLLGLLALRLVLNRESLFTVAVLPPLGPFAKA